MQLKWSHTYDVYVPGIDEQHREIFRAAGDLYQAILDGAGAEELRRLIRGLVTHTAEHFEHEERLMRAARYTGYAWHKRLHDGAKSRLLALERARRNGNPEAAVQLVEFVVEWMKEHTRLADIMMGAHLRNHERAHARAVSVPA